MSFYESGNCVYLCPLKNRAIKNKHSTNLFNYFNKGNWIQKKDPKH